MKRYLYLFGYESPVEREENIEHGTDFESSSAFWVEAESADDALRWGREVSDAMVHEYFLRSGWTRDIPNWKEEGFAHWIEDNPLPEFTPEYLSNLLVVRQGEMPTELGWLTR